MASNRDAEKNLTENLDKNSFFEEISKKICIYQKKAVSLQRELRIFGGQIENFHKLN